MKSRSPTPPAPEAREAPPCNCGKIAIHEHPHQSSMGRIEYCDECYEKECARLREKWGAAKEEEKPPEVEEPAIVQRLRGLVGSSVTYALTHTDPEIRELLAFIDGRKGG